MMTLPLALPVPFTAEPVSVRFSRLTVSVWSTEDCTVSVPPADS
jgi:hypothetical protein